MWNSEMESTVSWTLPVKRIVVLDQDDSILHSGVGAMTSMPATRRIATNPSADMLDGPKGRMSLLRWATLSLRFLFISHLSISSLRTHRAASCCDRETKGFVNRTQFRGSIDRGRYAERQILRLHHWVEDHIERYQQARPGSDWLS